VSFSVLPAACRPAPGGAAILPASNRPHGGSLVPGKRRQNWWLPTLVLLLSLALACVAETTQPNLLILFSDDQRAGTIHALGNPDIYTPNLDRLAADGMAFTRAYIMGGLQGAVCVPSRAMLMTSRGLFRVQENLASQRTWPEQFAQAGYRTFMTGKWHNGAASATRAFATGRNVFFGGMSAAHNMPVQDFSVGQPPGPKHTNAQHHTELFADTAIEFLRQQTNRQPFLCYVAFKSPHDPRTATSAWHERYRSNPPPLPPAFREQHPFDNGEMTVRDEQLLSWPRTPEAVRRELGDYYACISHLDEQIGRILEVLRATGLATNTLIAFAGDNGLALGSHGLMGKQNVYEHSVGVPLILAGPGIPQGRRTEALTYLLDVFPTLAELAAVPPLEKLDGCSLVPVLTGRTNAVRNQIFTVYRSFQRAIRDGRWKIIRYPLVDQTQLFDLQADPYELKNLASEPAHASRVAESLAALAKAQQTFGDTAPLSVVPPKPAAWNPPQPETANPSRKRAASKQP
jgi:arylsulfatase A-like enzyme